MITSLPLFIKGSVSFGTVIATLIATTGDSAFVLMTVSMKAYIWVSILSYITAIVCGYLVDYLKLEDKLNLRKNINANLSKSNHKPYQGILTEYERRLPSIESSSDKRHIGHAEGDFIDIALHHSDDTNRLSERIYKFTHGIGYKIFWFYISIGLILGIALLVQIDVNADFLIPNLGKFIGVGGTLFSIIYMILNKKFLKDDDHPETESKLFSLKETFIHNASETAFVATWVFLAYLVYDVGIYFIGGEVVIENILTATGLASVIIGALIGLIPGCGPQIIFVTLYTKGFVPFAALLSNAISQDGDALFPLIVMDKKSSMWATIITTVPAILVGVLYYFLEIYLL
ncbi:putative manganese transporter [Clostridium sp.]|uniref:putative manganese transporter n=1 Tax=Clostridium sp. TaxID=1506 RepID=UPI003463F7DD